jgi:hypothetical protein
MAKKQYQLSKSEKEVHYKEFREPTTFFSIEGVATIDLWGDGSGSIEMDVASFQAHKLTKAVIYANLNDGQFGCQDILSANVTVEQKVKVTRIYANEDGVFFDDNKTLFEEYETVIDNMYISKKKDFDEKVGHPNKAEGRGGYEFKELK